MDFFKYLELLGLLLILFFIIEGGLWFIKNRNSKKKLIKIKYHTDNIELSNIPQGDWQDLKASIDIDISRFESAKIPLGVSIQVPSGYEAHVSPRSSTYEKWGIIQTNSVGVIDEKYCGNNDIWAFPALAMRDTKIRKGDRICQFRIISKQPKLLYEVVEDMKNENRGGFGSTGTR